MSSIFPREETWRKMDQGIFHRPFFFPFLSWAFFSTFPRFPLLHFSPIFLHFLLGEADWVTWAVPSQTGPLFRPLDSLPTFQRHFSTFNTAAKRKMVVSSYQRRALLTEQA
ncbi:hypothetical protein BCR44DRAFT_222666 [Catenaria anguillulae PL171]|uniref:Uncharacterized protein n=1 Tax=Catenaria anguillulae PL171 TaxID=765915 RepID=A0A1Y2HBR7_9FUNG|nr:hypothetical protein BCR44DRAFT_222666 [Catenaria anguillulae PL171]